MMYRGLRSNWRSLGAGPGGARGILLAVTIRRLTSGRSLPVRLLLVAASVLLLVLVPTADLLAFGFHEHVVPPERSSDLSDQNDTQSSTLSHHCELSVSTGELLTAVELPAPGLLTIDATEHQSAAPRHRPFVPLTPPRS